MGCRLHGATIRPLDWPGQRHSVAIQGDFVLELLDLNVYSQFSVGQVAHMVHLHHFLTVAFNEGQPEYDRKCRDESDLKELARLGERWDAEEVEDTSEPGDGVVGAPLNAFPDDCLEVLLHVPHDARGNASIEVRLQLPFDPGVPATSLTNVEPRFEY